MLLIPKHGSKQREDPFSRYRTDTTCFTLSEGASLTVITSITDCSDCTLSAGSASVIFFFFFLETNYNRILAHISSETAVNEQLRHQVDMKSLHSLASGPIELNKCINAIKFLQYANEKNYLIVHNFVLHFTDFF